MRLFRRCLWYGKAPIKPLPRTNGDNFKGQEERNVAVGLFCSDFCAYQILFAGNTITQFLLMIALRRALLMIALRLLHSVRQSHERKYRRCLLMIVVIGVEESVDTRGHLNVTSFQTAILLNTMPFERISGPTDITAATFRPGLTESPSPVNPPIRSSFKWSLVLAVDIASTPGDLNGCSFQATAANPVCQPGAPVWSVSHRRPDFEFGQSSDDKGLVIIDIRR